MTVERQDGLISTVRTEAGAFLHGRSVDGCPASGDALLAVRPERMALLDDGAPGPDGAPGNVLPGTVRESVMLGAMTRLEIETASGQRLAALLLTTGQTAPRPGAAVRLGWPAEAGIVMPRGDA